MKTAAVGLCMAGAVRVTDIHGERIVGVLTDDVDVEFVVVFSP